MHIQAPAKINLSLRILRRRDDGFHELTTRMAPIALFDELTFTPADSYRLTCSDETVPTDESNLVTRAHHALEAAIGRPLPYHIHLEKHIPHGAGLGGGSSDAAFTLLTLNELADSPLTLEQLSAIGAELGSDVPFFLYRRVCDCEGRGEQITPVDDFTAAPYLLLLKPSFGVSTPDAYKRWLDSKEIPSIPYQAQTPEAFPGLELVNDLERPVFEKHRFLAELKNFLLKQDGCLASLMSGSGSTVFAVVEDAPTARAIRNATLAELDPTLWSWHGPLAIS